MKAKTFIRSASTWLVTAILATATPDHEVKVEERILGSNPEGFITLRTEVDNLGSYYGSRTRRYLVEYSKLPKDKEYEENLGAEVRRQLLLDVSTSVGVERAEPNSPEAKAEKTLAKDEDVKLADLLLRFPDVPKRWNDGKCGKLSYDSTGGPHLGRIGIAWGGWIKERFGVDRNSDLNWDLSEVFEDGNCLFLSVRSESHGQRLVSIPPRKTQQVRDHLALQAVYLVAGKFKSEDEAVKRGRELMEKTRGRFKPEVWSSGREKANMIYVLVDSESVERMKGDAFETLEGLTGVDFTVMSSESFDERIPIVPLR